MHVGKNMLLEIYFSTERAWQLVHRHLVASIISKKNIFKKTLTTIENNNGYRVSTIEHLMAALCGSGIDNIEVEIDGDEVPIMDGSSLPFIKLIEGAGIVSLPIKRKFTEVHKIMIVR